MSAQSSSASTSVHASDVIMQKISATEPLSADTPLAADRRDFGTLTDADIEAAIAASEHFQHATLTLCYSYVDSQCADSKAAGNHLTPGKCIEASWDACIGAAPEGLRKKLRVVHKKDARMAALLALRLAFKLPEGAAGGRALDG